VLNLRASKEGFELNDDLLISNKAGLPTVISRRQALTTNGGISSNGSYENRT